jgi:hypothetical protein
MTTPNTAWSPYPHGNDNAYAQARERGWAVAFTGIGPEHPYSKIAATVLPQSTRDLLAAEQAQRDLDSTIAEMAKKNNERK